MKNYRRFEYEDRCQLYALVKRGLTQEESAAALGFSQGTVSRELKRNRGKRGYRFKQAQSKTAHRQHAVRQLARKLTNVLRRRIERKLRHTFKQRDITKAVKAVVAAGVQIERVEVDKDGRISVVMAKPIGSAAASGNELDNWISTHAD